MKGRGESASPFWYSLLNLERSEIHVWAFLWTTVDGRYRCLYHRLIWTSHTLPQLTANKCLRLFHPWVVWEYRHSRQRYETDNMHFWFRFVLCSAQNIEINVKHLFIYLYFYLFFILFILLFIHSFIYALISLFIYAFIHLFIHLFMHLLIYTFIYSWVRFSPPYETNPEHITVSVSPHLFCGSVQRRHGLWHRDQSSSSEVRHWVFDPNSSW